jgi:predicted NBD/HSP70 family sugar kinase
MIVIDGVYQKVVKKSNRRKIFNYLRKKHPATKLEISRELDLSITTVTSNIKELESLGYVSEGGFEESTGGRKAKVVEFHSNAALSLGVEFKEDRGRIILLNLDREIVKQKQIRLKKNGKLADQAVDEITKALTEWECEDTIAGCGISLPGIVDSEKWVLVSAPNMNLANCDLSPLKDAFSFSVYIENEANCAAFAEWLDSDLEDSLCYVSITEGIGGALIVDQHILSGKNHRAGEIGHMSVDRKGTLCSCGKKGCWEQYASEKALIELLNKYTKKEYTIDEAFGLYSGDSKIRKAVGEYAANVAQGLSNLMMIFDPGVIVIGGTVAKFSDPLLDLIGEELKQNSFVQDKNEILLSFSGLEENGGILGAALLVQHSMFT